MNKPPLPSCHLTEDGSLTLYNATLGEHYHSTHGAMQESMHIFIHAGLLFRASLDDKKPLRVLEIGFGTGLNALLSLEQAQLIERPLHYTSLELYPVPKEIYHQLSYQTPHDTPRATLIALHEATWGENYKLNEYFTLRKEAVDLLAYTPQGEVDLIYFDAFSPETQAELWSEEIFRRLYEHTAAGAVLVTYCAKGEVRRRLQRAGFVVSRLPGPPDKREILRAAAPLLL
ncbi:MAG: tRNA (5-methylaminomethyl-2-thiouridine)(34)-methyltransferase MnmD [Porphyromonadaceae bacterium]|nr:tRNA (5-methylaminomethyl-2-thiouridine)(34)-methyltransferase MnmD [Porphyromonadaceae bacterium]